MKTPVQVLSSRVESSERTSAARCTESSYESNSIDVAMRLRTVRWPVAVGVCVCVALFRLFGPTATVNRFGAVSL